MQVNTILSEREVRFNLDALWHYLTSPQREGRPSWSEENGVRFCSVRPESEAAGLNCLIGNFFQIGGEISEFWRTTDDGDILIFARGA